MAGSPVDAYLARTPEPARSTLDRIRKSVRAAAPRDAVECISYGVPAFRYKGALVAYGASARHCSFYPMSPAVIEAFRGALARYETSKGTIRFPLDTPLPATLVRKLVRARVAENEARGRVW